MDDHTDLQKPEYLARHSTEVTFDLWKDLTLNFDRYEVALAKCDAAGLLSNSPTNQKPSRDGQRYVACDLEL